MPVFILCMYKCRRKGGGTKLYYRGDNNKTGKKKHLCAVANTHKLQHNYVYTNMFNVCIRTHMYVFDLNSI